MKTSGCEQGARGHEMADRQRPRFRPRRWDDHTDEDTFKALPEDAWSVKVGLSGRQPGTTCRHRLRCFHLLHELLSTES